MDSWILVESQLLYHFNQLAGHVTCYMPAEILILAHGGNDHYIDFFSADTSEQRVRWGWQWSWKEEGEGP